VRGYFRGAAEGGEAAVDVGGGGEPLLTESAVGLSCQREPVIQVVYVGQ